MGPRKKEPGFWRKLIDTLAPPENRLIAVVAFVRTFKQNVKSTGTIGGAAGLVITAQDVINVNWQLLGYTAIAVGLSALLAGADAYFDVLANGMSPKYAEALYETAQKQAIVEDKSLAQASTVQPVKADPPVVTPNDPGYPAI